MTKPYKRQKGKTTPSNRKLIVKMTKTKTTETSEKLIVRKTKTKNEWPPKVKSFVIWCGAASTFIVPDPVGSPGLLDDPFSIAFQITFNFPWFPQQNYQK